MFDTNVESPFRFESNTLTVDSNVFPVCTTNKTYVKRFLKRKIVYAHNDGKDMNIVVVDAITGEITRSKS